ncbi:hypothetical protein B0A52_05216 [Exophiala mesophila]|uniref:Cytochrome P450 n=1 Tax=Exophiala mesophila TaxID=212818 RepID=A0A438N4A6_EXOME|nr:hypothetical protein B0A52_05216 [Exophiala mesophila]
MGRLDFLEMRLPGNIMTSKNILAALVVVICSLVLYLRQLLLPVDKRNPPKGKRWKLPPGPQGFPILGNLFLFAKGEQAAYELAKFGEMATTHLGSKLWVILNSDRVATELYDRRSRVTNGRPHYPIAGDLISLNNRSVIMQTDGWTERRRVMHHLLSGTALVKYQSYQDEESIRMLSRYLESPSGWYEHHHHYSNSVIHRVTFGERPNGNDEKVKAMAHAQKLFVLNLPPMNIYDHFPELATLPRIFQWWRAKYASIGQQTFEAYSAYWNPHKEAIQGGRAPPSFARDVLCGEGSYKGSDVDAMFLATQLVEAGSDTTRLTFNMFALAAATQPDKYLRARTEIDALCGDAQRLPSFEDEKQLPYVNAFAKELLRWRPIFLWTPEHTLTEDLAFEGYYFPKGTHFVINQLAISSGSEKVVEPLEFRPERWLDGYESDLTRGIWQFGGGRRVCVGHRLAQKSLFINMARLIYCFDYEAVSGTFCIMLRYSKAVTQGRS